MTTPATDADGTNGAQRRPAAPWRIGVDVGGTFTDLVLADAQGATWVAKVPSVPADPSRGVHAALARVAVDLGMPLGDVLADCSLFVHGSTVATNTMLEGTGATVGLIATEGFPRRRWRSAEACARTSGTTALRMPRCSCLAT